MKHTNTGIKPGYNPFFKYLLVLVIFFSAIQSYGQAVCSGPIVVDAPSAPVIDGIVDPVWVKAPATPITKTVFGTLQSDYAATWQAMYDNTYLYVLIKVKDNSLTVGQGNPKNNDAIEIYIDGTNSKTTTYGANDFYYGYQLATPTIQPILYGTGNTTGVLSAMPNVPGGYNLEVAIPWSTIGGTATSGRQIGFDININDDDNGSSRVATSGWFSTSTQLATNPSLFGTVALTPCISQLTLSASHTDPNCGSTSDGTITMDGSGGTMPYSYTINGGAPTTNNVFTGLSEGTYKMTIKDASSPTQEIDTSITLATAGSSLAVNNDTSVCPGSSVKVSATGGISNNYTWTASPADPTLTTPNNASAIVTPAVTTSYTVTTAALGTNLIANPGFENGNVGFTSAYTYNTSSTFQSKIYSIEANPSTYNNYFTTCGDHTTGTGNMMVIDGGATPTDLLWGETVPVLSNSTYVFSYWIQTVDIGSGDDHQAQIVTKINGVAQGTQMDPVLGIPCGNWVKASYTWNSGAATSAQIYLYDLQTSAGGNDFALDDFSFTTGCLASKTVKVTIATPPAPTDTVAQPTCTIATGTITVTAPTSVTYSFDNGATYQAAATSSALAGNATYQVKVKNSIGCISSATATVINAQPATPAAPTASATQPTCTTATGTITVTVPSSGVTYSFDNGATYQTSATSPALTANATYQVVVKTTAGCISPATAVVLNAQPSTPAAPTTTVTQPTCTVTTGTITVTAPTTGVTYSFDNGGTYQASATSPALTANATYQVVVKNSVGCISSATATAINTPASVPSAPTATATQPTCTTATGTINITAPTTGVTYSFDNGASYQASATSPALAANTTYQLIVKNAAGCVSPATSVTLNAQPTTPAAPTTTVTQATCTTATGKITVTAPITGVTYSFDNGATYQVSATSSALTANTTYQVIVKNTAGCISPATATVLNAQPATPAMATFNITQPTCTVETGTVTVLTPATGVTYSFDNGTTYQASAIASGLTANTTYEVIVKNIAGCLSPTVAAALTAAVPVPDAPTATATQPTCTTTTGTINVTAPTSGVTYSFDNGTTYQASATSPALTANATYQVIVKTTDGCISPSTPIILNAQPATPAAPTTAVTQATCTTATGTINVTAPASGVTYSFNNGSTYQASSTSAALASNATYQVLVKSAAGCISPATATVLNAQPSSPAAPTTTVTQATCTTATGTINVTTPTSGITYSFDNGATYQSSSTSTALASNATYQVVVKNTTGCISPATATIINAQPATPAAPNTTVTQPTCTIATGTINVTVPSSGVIYSFDNGITYQSSSTSTALASNATYQVVVKNTTGCISPATATIINAQPATPAAPTASAIQATCTTATGTINVTTPSSGVTYSFDNGSSYQASSTSSALASNATYQVVIKNTSGCISSASAVTLNAQPPSPSAPTVSITQPTCSVATGTVTVTAPTNGVTYSFDNGASFQASATSAALNTGSYKVQTKNTTGCVSAITTAVIAPPLSTVPPPAVSSVAYCQDDKAVSLSSLATGTSLAWYTTSVGGIGTSIAPVPVTYGAGVFSYYVTQSQGLCESPRAVVTVTVHSKPQVFAGGPVVYLVSGEAVQLKGIANGDNVAILWSPDISIDNTAIAQPTVNPTNTITYTISVTGAGKCTASDTVNVIVRESIFIPNVFSPNGDGMHDTWLINNINEYPGAQVKIFNRYGQLILESAGYNQPWDGTYQGKAVPVGAYYYIIKLTTDAAPLAGSVSVIR